MPTILIATDNTEDAKEVKDLPADNLYLLPTTIVINGKDL
ncbi:MAG: hypothetical protein ACJA13_000104 [Paraglaciecola sp.]|jgi:hypothetical protein